MSTQEQKRRETIMSHITLNTGHYVTQTWSDINPDIVDILRNDLSPLFLSDGQRRIQGLPGFPCYRVEGWSPNPTTYTLTVYSNPERVPLIQIAVGLSNHKHAFAAWLELCAVARSVGVPGQTLGALQARPLPPWCGVLFLPGLGNDPDMVEWLSGRRERVELDTLAWLMPRLRYPDERPSSRLRNGVSYEPDPENDPDTVDCLSQFERCVAWAVWERLERMKERILEKARRKIVNKTIACLALVALTSPAFAFEGAWGDLAEGRNTERWATPYEEPRRYEYGVGANDPLVQKYRGDHVEPGHIPYGCGMMGGNAAARDDCQEDWEAHNPNDYLHW